MNPYQDSSGYLGSRYPPARPPRRASMRWAGGAAVLAVGVAVAAAAARRGRR